MGRRGKFTSTMPYLFGAYQTLATIVAYAQPDSTIDVYLRMSGAAWHGASVSLFASGWGISGHLYPSPNPVTTEPTGTLVYNSVQVKPAFVISNTGNIGVGGVLSPQDRLAVNGNISAQRITVTQKGWPDYVFDSAYQLEQLDNVAAYINEHKHLPGVTAAQEIEQSGLNIGEIMKQQQQKIEELTLYLIELNKKNELLQQRMGQLERTSIKK